MKRFVTLLLSVLMVASLCMTGVLAAGKPTFTVATVEAGAGEEAVVAISLDTNPGIAAMNMKISYDTERLTLTGYENAGLTDWSVGVGAGEKAVWVSENGSAATGAILKLKFRVAENAPAGLASITLTGMLCADVDENAVSCNIVAGGVTVVSTGSGSTEPEVPEEPTAIPTLTVATVDGAVGEEVTVAVSLDTNPGIAAMNMKISYDTARLTLTGYENAGLTDWSVGVGTGEKAVWVSENGSTATGAILKLKFKVAENATAGLASVTLTGLLCADVDENAVSCNIVAGGVNVAAQQAATSGTLGNDVTWSLSEDGTLTFTGTGAMRDVEDDFPWNPAAVKKIVVTGGITSVGMFGGPAPLSESHTALSEVVFDEGVKTIGKGYGTFIFHEEHDAVPMQIHFPSTVESIANSGPFYGAEITATYAGTGEQWLQVMNSVLQHDTSGGDCEDLYTAHVTCADGTVFVSFGVIEDDGCWAMTEDGVMTIFFTGDCHGEYMPERDRYLADAAKATKLVIAEGVTAVDADLVAPCGDITTVTLPASLAVIGDDTFASCTKLAAVEYAGTQKQWNAIEIGTGNGKLTEADITPELVAMAAKAATCTEDGNSAYYRKVKTGRLYRDAAATQETTLAAVTIKAKGHTVVTDAAVEPTCMEVGWTEGSHCSVCGERLTAPQAIPAAGHAAVTDKAVAATCTTAGKTEGKHCSVCVEVLLAQEVIPAKGHTPVVDEAVAPTCMEAGLTEGSHCATCHTILVSQQEVEALGHSFDAGVVTKAATCTAKGVRTFTCTRDGCGEQYIEVIPATGHTPVVDEAVAPTCTERGLTEGSHCAVCQAVLVEQEEIALLGHTYDAGVITKAPTCTETGVRTYTCTRDGCTASYQEPVAMVEHTVVIDTAVEPTCTEEGKTEGSHCPICGEVLTAQEEILAKGHIAVVDATIEPTCTVAGKTEGSHCSVCGEVLTAQEEIPARGHEYVLSELTKPATCTEAGEGTYTCTREGCHEGKTEVIPATGHSIVKDPAVEATSTSAGLTEGSHCKVCGTVLVVQQEVPAKQMEAPEGMATSVSALKLTWKQQTGATGYEIYRSRTSDGEFALVKTITSAKTVSFADARLSAGKVYYYKMRPYRLVGTTKVYGDFTDVVAVGTKLAQAAPSVKRVGTVATITWKPVQNAVHYWLYVDDGYGYVLLDEMDAVLGKTLYSTTMEVSTVGSYSYYLEACSADEVRSNSKAKVSKGTIKAPALAVKTAADLKSITLTWKAVPGATGYLLYLDDGNADRLYRTYTETDLADIMTETIKVAPVGIYKFRLYAVADAAGQICSAATTKTVKTALKAPAPTVKKTAFDQVTITWKNVPGALGYEVQRGLSKTGPFETVYTVEADSTLLQYTYEETVLPGVTYYYKVTSVWDTTDDTVMGILPAKAFSAVKSVAMAFNAPAPVLKQVAGTKNIQVTWKAVPGAQAYRLYRSTTKTGTYEPVYEGSDLSFRDMETVAGTTYFYKAVAVYTNSIGEATGKVSAIKALLVK